MYPALPWTSFALLVLSLLLWPRQATDRGRIRGAWGFLALWLCAYLSGHLSRLLGQDPKVFDETGRAFVELAVLNLGTILVFDYALSRIRLPRLATEVALVAGFVAVVFRLLTRMGSDLTSLIATSAVATAVIGFALQDMLGNIVGGAMLELEGGICTGDWIRVNEAYGCVQRVRLRYTELLTGDGETVFLPNSLLTRSAVTKVKHLRRKYIPFLAPYSHSPQDVQKAIELALTGSPLPGVATEPQPKCIVQEFAQFHVKYAAVVWLTEPGHENTAISGVLTRIYYALSRTGIPVSEIPQIIELHKPKKEDAQSKALSVLRSTPIFRLLAEEDMAELAARMSRYSFAPGEYLIRQGEQGASMFFITAGECAIVLSSGHKGSVQVATLEPGDFLGEASLLTGEPRNASAIAVTAVDCYELDKRGLQDLMERRPEIAEDMAVIIAHRSTELTAVREHLGNSATRRPESESHAQWLTKIRRFFGIDAKAVNE